MVNGIAEGLEKSKQENVILNADKALPAEHKSETDTSSEEKSIRADLSEETEEETIEPRKNVKVDKKSGSEKSSKKSTKTKKKKTQSKKNMLDYRKRTTTNTITKGTPDAV